MLFFTNSCFPPGAPKKHPQITPKWTPKATQEASRGPEMSIASDLGFKLHFQVILGRFWDPKSDPKWTPKSLKNLSWEPRGAPGTPKGARRPPGSDFGAVWDPFWSDFGTQFWSDLGIILKQCLQPAASPLLLPCRPRFSGSAGARVSAYN